MNPSIKVVKVSMLTMVCGSLDPLNGKGTVTEETVVSGTAGEARSSNLWDDDE